MQEYCTVILEIISLLQIYKFNSRPNMRVNYTDKANCQRKSLISATVNKYCHNNSKCYLNFLEYPPNYFNKTLDPHKIYDTHLISFYSQIFPIDISNLQLNFLLIFVTCLWLITVCHQDLSQPVQASFSQSEEVFYRSHITILLRAFC